MEGLRELGEDVWFNLGDRDLAVCVQRARAAGRGRAADARRSTSCARRSACRARVLPMSDEPVRTRVRHAGRWWPFQEYLIRARAAAPVDGVEFEGAAAAPAAPEALEAIAAARAIVIGPSNPVISIGPILAVPGLREALPPRPRPWSPSRPWSAAGAQGTDATRSCSGRAAARRAAGSRPATRA